MRGAQPKTGAPSVECMMYLYTEKLSKGDLHSIVEYITG